MAAVSPPETLLTAEQFGERPDPGYPEELVRGRVVTMPPPKPRHGIVCCEANGILRSYVKDHGLGRVMSNDTGVITERGPDTVRGVDVAYYSYERFPKGPIPEHYLNVAPELVIEVLSPSDRWPKVLAKVSEYLLAGVLYVVVLDYESRSARIFGTNGQTTILSEEDELTLPEILGDFRVAVGRFFD